VPDKLIVLVAEVFPFAYTLMLYPVKLIALAVVLYISRHLSLLAPSKYSEIISWLFENIGIDTKNSICTILVKLCSLRTLFVFVAVQTYNELRFIPSIHSNTYEQESPLIMAV
jgi:hypothetical protein